MANTTPTPYRVIVFGTTTITTGTGKRQRTETRCFGYVSWNADESARLMFDPGRLPGAGTFCYPGIEAARAVALIELSKPGVHQVAIKTNQDRDVERLYKTDALHAVSGKVAA